MNISQSYGSGGSVNSAQSSGWSQSGTMAEQARAWSEAQSALAWQRDLEAMQMQMNFNATEAQKQRDWQEQMANTVYTRSVKNMREAGINPILAANMGLSGANVGSGATASIGGAPSAPVAQNFMDSWSAAQNMSESHGESWNSSESGLITALTAFGGFIQNAADTLASGMKMQIGIGGLSQLGDELFGGLPSKIEKYVTNWLEDAGIKSDDDTEENKPSARLSNGSVNAGSGKYSSPYGTSNGRYTY